MTGKEGGNKTIGGFFGMELPVFDNFPQSHGEWSVMVNSGRCALEYILRSLMRRGELSRIYIPYYTCETVLEPVERLGIPCCFYHVDEGLEVDEACFPAVSKGEYLLYTNYFGLKQSYVERLSLRLKGRLIVDNCMALYAAPLPGIPSMYSPRKWSGLADGGVAVLDGPSVEIRETDESWQASGYLLRCLERGVEDAFEDCEKSEERLKNAPLMKMSSLTRLLMRGVDYEAAAKARRANFQVLHERLGALNKLDLPLKDGDVPYCYPLWTNLADLRDHLIDHGILIPILWDELPCLLPEGVLEERLVAGILPLPVDQRYSVEEMKRVLQVIGSFYA